MNYLNIFISIIFSLLILAALIYFAISIKIIFTSRIKKYKTKYIKHFDIISKNEVKINDYENLIELIKAKYESRINKDEHRVFMEKVRAQDNIENADVSDISSYIFSFISAAITIFIFIIKFLMDKNVDVTKTLLEVVVMLTILICLVFLIVSCQKVIDTHTVKSIKGYNKICLEVLNQIENEINLELEKIKENIELKNVIDELSKQISFQEAQIEVFNKVLNIKH